MGGTPATPYTSSTDLPHLRALFDIYFSFHIVGGHVLIPVLLVTFLLSKAKRDATLINLGMTLMLSSIFSCLLLYAHEYLGPEPNKRLCISQAAAFGASAPMWSVSSLTLVLQIRSRVELKTIRWRWLFVMLIAPYVVFIAFFVIVLVVGLQRPDAVTRSRRTLYCSLESRIISLVSIGFTSTTSFVAIGIGATMSYQLCSFLRLVSRAREPQIRIIPLAIRLLIFMVYLFFALATSLWSIQDHNTYIRDIYTSTFAVAYFLVFGTQRDIFRAWCFWRKEDAMEAETRTSETGARTAEDVTTVTAGQTSVASFSGTTRGMEMHGLHSVFSRYDSFTAKNMHIIVTSTIDTDDGMTDISQSYTSQNFYIEESGGVPTAM